MSRLATLVAIAVLLLAGPSTGWAGTSRQPPAAGGLVLQLDELAPRVVTTAGPSVLTVTGTLTNTGDAPVTAIGVRLQRGEPLRTEAAVRDALEAEGHDPELVQLLISDAVLREIPALERFQAFLRLVIAAGPLLGLVGTVIGMIITFKAITAAGSGDPTLMARGIGQAMIATVLGLGVAIPLLFINAGLSARSRRIGQTLDEQGFQLLADVTGGQEFKSPARA